jgi:hypothetical protein
VKLLHHLCLIEGFAEGVDVVGIPFMFKLSSKSLMAYWHPHEEQ